MAGTIAMPEMIVKPIPQPGEPGFVGPMPDSYTHQNTQGFVGPPAPTTPDFGRVAIQMLPFTAVSFSETPLLAWGRLLGYSALAAMLWTKHKQLAYVAGSAAGLSLVTSLTASVMAKK